MLKPAWRTGPVRGARRAFRRAHPSLFGLAPCGVYRATAVTVCAVGSYPTFSPLPRQGLAIQAYALRAGPGCPPQRGSRGGLFSVALAVYEPSQARIPDVIRHTALWSSDFPPPRVVTLARLPPAATARSSCQWLVYLESEQEMQLSETTINNAMIQYLYLGRIGYDEGLKLQEELVQAVIAGRTANTLLLLEHPPVLTLGRNANRSNILATDAMLAARGVTVHEINRGGDVTYHGPGQLVGYPIFDLRTLHTASGKRMGPVDFVRLMEEALIRVSGHFGVPAFRIPGLTGVWCGPMGSGALEDGVLPSKDHPAGERKIGAIGIHVSRGVTSHGFAYNVTTRLEDFLLINPCGITDRPVTSLEREVPAPTSLPVLEEMANLAARQFGLVLGEQVLAVENLAALRAHSGTSPAVVAEDTPCQAPAEVERLLHPGEPMRLA